PATARRRRSMKTWTTALALLAAGTLVAGPAFAQATSPAGDQKDKANKTDSTTKSDSSTMKSSDTKSPDMKSSSDAKSSDMKSSSGAESRDMKSSDSMKSSDGMKSAKSGKGGMAKGGNMEQVRAVQQALKDKGHDPGDVDGKMGPKTQAALRDYQSKEGLKASGRLDAETMTKLGVDSKSSATAGSSPAASPSPHT